MICLLAEMYSVAAAITWLMPSVAMNELTWKYTMISPDRNPTAAQATMAMRQAITTGQPGVRLEPADDHEREGEHRPDRQVEGPRRQRDEQGEAEDGDDDLVGEHLLERHLGEERLGDPQPEEHEDEPEQVHGARLVQPGQAECRPLPTGRDRRRGHAGSLSCVRGCLAVVGDDWEELLLLDLARLDVLARQLGADPPAPQHDDACRQTGELVGVGRAHDDRGAGGRGLVDEAVDVGLGADVDALGRLVEHEHARLDTQPPGHHDLLGVAARTAR